MSAGLFLSNLAFGVIFLLTATLTIFFNTSQDPCNLVNSPDLNGMTHDDCEVILLNVASKSSGHANLIYLLTLASRIEAAILMALGLASLHAISLPLLERKGLMMFVFAASVLCGLVDGQHAGIVSWFGKNAMITPEGAHAGGMLAILWVAVAVCMLAGLIELAVVQRLKEKEA